MAQDIMDYFIIGTDGIAKDIIDCFIVAAWWLKIALITS
jgi:hypothetical protein